MIREIQTCYQSTLREKLWLPFRNLSGRLSRPGKLVSTFDLNLIRSSSLALSLAVLLKAVASSISTYRSFFLNTQSLVFLGERNAVLRRLIILKQVNSSDRVNETDKKFIDS